VRMLVATSSVLAAMTVDATTSVAIPRYDGLWSVSIVTDKGDCDRGYRYPIRIESSVLTNGGEAAFTISGKVAAGGAITVIVSYGDKSAKGVGRLAGDSGLGSWRGGSCSGTWTAERRGA